MPSIHARMATPALPLKVPNIVKDILSIGIWTFAASQCHGDDTLLLSGADVL